MDFIKIHKIQIKEFMELTFNRSVYKTYCELFSKAWSKKENSDDVEAYYGNVTDIARNTGFSRPTIYKALEFLLDRYYCPRGKWKTVKSGGIWTPEEVKKQPWRTPYIAKNKTEAGPFIEFSWKKRIYVLKPRDYKGGFIKVDSEIFDKVKNLSVKEAKIWFYILFENKQRNKTWTKFSLNSLAKKLKIRKDKVASSLRNMEEMGLLNRERKKRKDNRCATTDITVITEIKSKKLYEKSVIISKKISEVEVEKLLEDDQYNDLENNLFG